MIETHLYSGLSVRHSNPSVCLFLKTLLLLVSVAGLIGAEPEPTSTQAASPASTGHATLAEPTTSTTPTESVVGGVDPYILELLSANKPKPPTTLTFNNFTYNLSDDNKELIDYDEQFLDALTFVQTEKAAGENALKRLESMIAKHHDNEELHDYLFEIAQQYPEITKMYSIGESVQGRKLWALEITENPGKHKLLKPEFKYVANIHGNEVVGRELLLHLARLLVENYRAAQEEPSTDERPTPAKFVRKLLQQTRIHILPSMNPDGYFRSRPSCQAEQNSLHGRLNANNIDMNRNFPDPILLNKQDGNTQPEVAAMIKWSKSIPFVLSANLQGSALVVSYPYDGSPDLSSSRQYRATPDDDVFKSLASSYAKSHHSMWTGNKCYDRCSELEPDTFADGITNGAAWAPIHGGMQDWIYENTNAFEVTVELGCNQYPEAASLAQYWLYNKRALLNYIKEAHRGIKGTVSDATTGALLANVTVHVEERAHNVTSTPYGDFFRILLPGRYRLLFEKAGYASESVFVTVQKSMAVIVNIKLQPLAGAGGHQNSTAQAEPPNGHGALPGEPAQKEAPIFSLLVSTLILTIVILLLLVSMAGAYVIQKRRYSRSKSVSMELQQPSRSTGVRLGAGSSSSTQLCSA